MNFFPDIPLVESYSGSTQSSASPEDYQPISVEWLGTKNNWPEHLADKLQELMNAHDLKNYKSTNYESRRKLKHITNELQIMFDQQKWKNSVHREKLETKIRNKIHRIRAKEAKERNALARLAQLQRNAQRVTWSCNVCRTSSARAK
ncbi:MAG: hypothetical protein MMC33_007361 [Icmadophila ericetorum]|nr:hypothetical protein [Icmadophila ericetorum]